MFTAASPPPLSPGCPHVTLKTVIYTMAEYLSIPVSPPPLSPDNHHSSSFTTDWLVGIPRYWTMAWTSHVLALAGRLKSWIASKLWSCFSVFSRKYWCIYGGRRCGGQDGECEYKNEHITWKTGRFQPFLRLLCVGNKKNYIFITSNKLGSSLYCCLVSFV